MSNKIRVTFLGQLFYFNCCIPDKLHGFEVHKLDLNITRNLEKIRHHKSDIWFIMRPDFLPLEILNKLEGIKIWVSTEPIERADVIPCMRIVNNRSRFDLITHYDKTHLKALRLHGINAVEFQLPVNLNQYHKRFIKNKHEVCFLGRSTPYREEMMGMVKRDFDLIHVAHGSSQDEFCESVSSSHISLNLHIEKGFAQLQHRMQNMIACGGFVLSHRLTHDDGLKAGVHYVEVTTPIHLHQKVLYYIGKFKRNDLCEMLKISGTGMEYVHEHMNAETQWMKLLKQVA